MNTPELAEAGTHEFDFPFVYGGVTFEVEGTTTNTLSDADRCELGYDNNGTIETTTTIELLSAVTGEDGQIILKDELLLQEIEAELLNY